MNELNEKYEQKYYSIRLEYETKIEQLTNEQQIQILTLKQTYENVLDEKYQINEQLNTIRFNEQNLQEKLDKIQMEYEQLLKLNKKPLRINVFTQTVRNSIKSYLQIRSSCFRKLMMKLNNR
jgi:flagellar biosynthesis component FlhA